MPRLFSSAPGPGGGAVLTRWRAWAFDLRVPVDEFVRALQRALVVRGVRVDGAARFDFVARAFGARAYVRAGYGPEGLRLVLKTKAGLFASPEGLERLLLEACHEAQTRLAAGGPTV